MKEVLKAIVAPKASQLAYKVYSFFQKESFRAARYIQGMKPIFHYLDKSYLREEMKQQMNMDFNKYSFAVDFIEEKMQTKIEEE